MSTEQHPDWLEILRREVEASSQSAVARRLGVSTAMVSQALRGLYKASTTRLEALVIGTFGEDITVDCPVCGEIPLRRCAQEQRRKFSVHSPQRVALSVACRTCPHAAASKTGGDR